jgi:hypothetical protein
MFDEWLANTSFCKVVFPKVWLHTTGGMRKDFKGFAPEKILLKSVPEFSLLSDELWHK